MRRRVEHGTYTAYAKGCRCVRCRAAWATYMRDYKQRTAGGYYRDKQVTVRVRLTPLAARILRDAAARGRAAGALPDDVVEQALRNCGPSVEFAAA